MKSRGLLLLASLLFLAGTCEHTPTTPVTAPPCGDPHNISCDDKLSSTPSIDVSPDGRIYLVWTRGISTDYQTFRPVFREFNGVSWSPVESLSTGPVWATHVAAGPEGEVHVVWEAINYDQSTSAVVYRMRDVQGHWHTPETLSVWSNPAKQARIDVDPTGRVHIIWGGRYRSRSPSGVWDVDESGVPVGENPSMVVDSTGRVHVIWGVGGVGSTLMYSTRIPGQGWSSRPVGRLDYPPQFLSLYKGQPIVCGVIQRSSGSRDWFIRCYHLNGSSWQILDTPMEYDVGYVVAAGVDNTLIVAYVQLDPPNTVPPADWQALWIRRYSNGQWSPPELLVRTEWWRIPILFPMAVDRSRGGVWLPYSKEITLDTLDFPEWDVFMHFLQP